MIVSDAIYAAQWVFLLYFIALNCAYLALNLVSLVGIRHYLDARVLDRLPGVYGGFDPPVSVLIPAHNEEATIAASVRSMLQLNYPEYEVIVINDGSRDGTLEALKREFTLAPFPEAYWRRIKTRPVRTIYQSAAHPNLRVIDKENGGKADALNAGINAARYPLVCGVDADSILERGSLRRVVAPFLEDPFVVASGGTVRIANGCQMSGGFLERVGLPGNPVALMQIVEYLRAFLFGRLGWAPLNAVLIISGAFGVFSKETVVAAGGYRTDTVGEDMELVVRLHRRLRLDGARYRIAFVPDPICWTEAPESLRVLRIQRERWQRGLSESLAMNIPLLFHARGGAVGWLAFPFMALFEWLGPAIEVVGYVFMTAAYVAGLISTEAFMVFLFVAFGFGLLLSLNSLMLEELSFHVYPRPAQLAVLVAAAVLENLGYRQLNSVWRFWGLARWASGARGGWGAMTRTSRWK